MATATEEIYLSPTQAAAIIPGMTRNNLGIHRFKGTGPKYLNPSPRVIVYRKSDIIAWLEGGTAARIGDRL